jgi:hypothetical protein
MVVIQIYPAMLSLSMPRIVQQSEAQHSFMWRKSLTAQCFAPHGNA